MKDKLTPKQFDGARFAISTFNRLMYNIENMLGDLKRLAETDGYKSAQLLESTGYSELAPLEQGLQGYIGYSMYNNPALQFFSDAELLKELDRRWVPADEKE